MIVKTSVLVLLQLATLQWTPISSLSVSSSGGSKNEIFVQRNQGGSSRNADQHDMATVSSSSSLPPLLSTIAQHSNQIQGSSKQQQRSKTGDRKQRSPGPDPSTGDDHVPLATINNHSRNNQPPSQSRPPQYVDVSALVGRNRTDSLGAGSLNSSMGEPGDASALTGKSRSGLPECATQQVCNAIFVRMNYTQKLCECSSNYNWRCSNTLDPQDGHTIELTRKFDKRIYTQIKTCEPLREVRACKPTTDWTLLALQSERSGKAHYVVVCKCPTWAQLEGPYTHNHPPYANIPGIRVYGMLCAHQTARSTAQTYAGHNPTLGDYPPFPWKEAMSVLNTTNLLSAPDSQ